MSRLLNAGFHRFFKSKIYLAGLIYIVGYCAILEISMYIPMKQAGLNYALDPFFFNFYTIVGVVASIFISMFVGTEYSDGTLRNKMIAGHKRTDIYLSNFFICATGGTVVMLAGFGVGIFLGIPLFGPLKMPVAQLALYMAAGILLNLVYVAVFNLVTMLSARKENSVVICILLSLLLMVIAAGLYSSLSQPEMIEQMAAENGKNIMETVRNPGYLEGTRREVYQFLMDLLPGGQAVQIVNVSVVNPVRMLISSVVLTALVNGAGIWLFSKKDIK